MKVRILEFELDFNEENRKAVARIIGKKRGLASEQEVRDCVIDLIGEKFMEALMR